MIYVLILTITDGYTFSCDEVIGCTTNEKTAEMWAETGAGSFWEYPLRNYLRPETDEIAKNYAYHPTMVPAGQMNLPEAVKFIREVMEADDENI